MCSNPSRSPTSAPASPGVRSFARALRALGFRIERARLATRIRELRDLVDVPHDLAEVARTRIDRLSRRERALTRLMG